MVAAVLITLGAQAFTTHHLWRMARRGWAKMDPRRRRRAVIAGVVELAVIAAIFAIAVVAPWGERTFAYVILAIAAITFPIMLLAVSVQARRDMRAARERRQARQERSQ